MRADALYRSIRNQEGGDYRQAWGVYLRNYLYGHLDALGNRFKTVKVAVGEDNFRYLGFQYLRYNAPCEPDIDSFGSEFPEFLAYRCDEFSGEFLAELAYLDDLIYLGDQNASFSCSEAAYELWNELNHVE